MVGVIWSLIKLCRISKRGLFSLIFVVLQLPIDVKFLYAFIQLPAITTDFSTFLQSDLISQLDRLLTKIISFPHLPQWFNSQEVVRHSGGHLPFEVEVTSLLHFGELNRITVAVNNTLTPNTLPPGTITRYNDLTM